MKTTRISKYQNSMAYVVLQKIRGLLREVRKETEERNSPEREVITLSPDGPVRGRVLFSYIIGGFLLESERLIPNKHTNIWQSLKMAHTFVELGYEVDVIHWTNNDFIPTKNYSFFVDVRWNLERLAALLNKDCVKIMHLDTAHILFHNAAEFNRLLQLQQRRGVTLKPKRFEMPNLGIEHADYATATGNDFVVDTFAYARKKTFKLPSPCAISMDKPQKNFQECRTRFLWFSSSGLVHKGLDLALEAFAAMPDCHLTICAPIEGEREFVATYHKELYETPNISTIGWVDIDSEQFRQIANSCVAIVHLSCSEGGAPAIKTCMHAGLIPVVSYESGVDVDDFGYCLTDCSIEKITDLIGMISTLSCKELEGKSSESWEFARRHYTRDHFSHEYRRVILEIVQEVYARRGGENMDLWDGKEHS